MRWAAVVSLTLALGSACGGRSEYFDGYTVPEGGEDAGGSSGRGGTSGVGGNIRGGTGGFTGGVPNGGSFPVGGTTTGGVPSGGTGFGGSIIRGGAPTGGTPAGGSFPVGGTSTTGGVPTGGTGPTGGVPPTGGVSGTGVGGTSAGRGGSNMGGTGGASPENCLECISTSCPEANECFQNPNCIEGLLCGAAACDGLEGAEALRCWTVCFDNDARLALQALTAALCLAQRCAVACQGF